MAKKNSLGINTDDFKSVKYKLFITNNSSGTELLDYTKIQLVGISKDGVTIVLPAKQCIKGHNLVIYFLEDDKKVDIKGSKGSSRKIKGAVEISFRVTEIQKSPLSTSRKKLETIILTLLEEKNYDWLDIIDNLVNKQKQVNKIQNIIDG